MTARSLCFALSTVVFATEVNANAILQVTGPNNWAISPAGNPDPSRNHIFLVASWDQTIGFASVNISFPGHGVSSAATGTAYLTTSMGIGTTIADQIAATTFSAPTGPSAPIQLFSGLTLPANLYYLMIFADPGSEIAWDATSPSTATTTLGAGVSLNPSFLYDGLDLAALGGSYAPYPPATDGVGFQDNLLMNVTSTPEPASMSLLAVVALAAVVLFRRSGRSGNPRFA
jgi:hypothetical protein